jgi:hypothetical protein
MKYLLIMIIMLIGSQALADSNSLNLSIPQVPSSYGQDRFRACDLDCANSIGSATNLEFGVTGIMNGGSNNPLNSDFGSSDPDIGVYARIIIPLGARPKSRVNCDTLYQLELTKKRLEIRKLEKELNELKSLQFQN